MGDRYGNGASRHECIVSPNNDPRHLLQGVLANAITTGAWERAVNSVHSAWSTLKPVEATQVYGRRANTAPRSFKYAVGSGRRAVALFRTRAARQTQQSKPEKPMIDCAAEF